MARAIMQLFNDEGRFSHDIMYVFPSNEGLNDFVKDVNKVFHDGKESKFPSEKVSE